MKRSPRNHYGFTLLEIMLVVLIIGLLIGMAIKFTGGHIGLAQDVRVKGDIENYKVQLMTYQTQNGFLPSTEQGLKVLVSKPDTDPRPRNWRQMSESLLLDPWDQEYFFVNPGKHNPHNYDLYSAGKDRIPDTADDIGNWENANK